MKTLTITKPQLEAALPRQQQEPPMNDELPPLPEPYLSAEVTASLLGPNVIEPLFIAAQMRAFRAEGVAAERERWQTPAFLWPVGMPDEVARWLSAHPPQVVPRDQMQRVEWPN